MNMWNEGISLRGTDGQCMTKGHIPVLLQEVLHVMSPRAGAVYVDGTFGGGGYTEALLEAAPCKVIAIDRDEEAIHRGQVLKEKYPSRLTLIQGCFGQMESLLRPLISKLGLVDGIVLDIGVSSQQLSDGQRGFSFMQDGPLDMRMGQQGITAADVINSYDEESIANILFQYGEEKKSRSIAKNIVKARVTSPIKTTKELVEIIYKSFPAKIRHSMRIDPATRTFQALRIYVNQELEELKEGLKAATALLSEGGQLIVVSFHSLEDRIVKDFFRSKEPGVSRYRPENPVKNRPLFYQTQSKPLTPSAAEMNANPRARSAKLRWGIRSAVPISCQQMSVL